VSKTSRSVLAQQQSGAARLRNKLLEEFERIEGLRSIERVKAPDWLECLSLLTNGGGGDGISQWVLPAKDISAERAGLRSERPAN